MAGRRGLDPRATDVFHAEIHDIFVKSQYPCAMVANAKICLWRNIEETDGIIKIVNTLHRISKNLYYKY